MTPDEIREAHDLLSARSEVREVSAYLVSHPSCHACFMVGKLNRGERIVENGCDITIPNDIAAQAFATIRSAIEDRLAALGVHDNKTE
jgi:hypothetical protein